MKKLFVILIGLISANVVIKAQQSYNVVYVQSRQSSVRIISDQMTDEQKERANRVRKTYFELHVINNESYYKESDRADAGEMAGGGGGGFGMAINNLGGNTETYTNLSKKSKTDKIELDDVNYLIDDSLAKLNWTFTNETKKIIGYDCLKATTKIFQPQRRMMMGGFGGRNRPPEVDSLLKPNARPDSLTVTVWYTKAIPLAFGPSYQGNLPGLILEIDNTFKNNVSVITAESITNKPNAKLVKLPTKGKKIARADFNAKREGLLKKMSDNMQNGGTIRMGAGN